MKSALEIMLEAAYNEGCKNGKKEVEAELTRTKRALWLARVKRANERANMLRYMWHVLVSVKKSKDKELVKMVRRDYDVWCEVERKCYRYADKFKEV